MATRTWTLWLLAIIVVTVGVRLPNIDQPLSDSLQSKQVYTANRARSIAKPPLNPMRSSLDFLNADDRRIEFTEEIPVYATLLAIGYRVFGEANWIGHALSLMGSIAAILAFFALVKSEWDDQSALIATWLFSIAPVFIFYGRAVMPDSWMLALLIASTASYRRFLDSEKTGWLVAASLCVLGAGLFKYYGLIVFIPLAEFTWRKTGTWRSVFSRAFVAMFATATVPIALWMVLVFFQTENPVKSGWIDGKVMPYLIFQSPGVMLSRGIYASFFGRFLIRDCGPITAVLLVVGVISWLRRSREKTSLIFGWSVMAIVYYVLLAPKLRDHDYYELLMVPAVALWGTQGLLAVARQLTPYRIPTRKFVLGTLLIAGIAQSPWLMGSLFRLDDGKVILAERLRTLTSPGSRIVAIGPGIEFPTVVHYSEREGWPLHSPTLPEDWRKRFARYHNSGASIVAVYFEPKATKAQRDSFAPLLNALPVVERRAGLTTRSNGTAEYIILDLSDARVASRLYPQAVGGHSRVR